MKISKFFLLITFMIVLSLSNQMKMMSYVEVNDNDLSAVGCYVRSDNGKPFFDFTSIFAANINGKDPNHPEIYFNWQVDELINKNHNKIEKLQSQGIKVFVTLLGNHFNAGWCCMTDQNQIDKFADDIIKMLNKYNLDGVDIDDEYSNCSPNLTSLDKIVKSLLNHPNLNNKYISIALWNNSHLFNQGELSKNLHYGWEMSYSGPYDRLRPYHNLGFDSEKLYLGLRFGETNAESYINIAKNYGGLMFFDVKKNGQDSLSRFTKIIYGESVIVKNICNNENDEEKKMNFLE